MFVHRAAQLLRSALLPRRQRSRVFPRRHPLPHLLVSRGLPLTHRRHLHDRRGCLERDWRTAVRPAAGARRHHGACAGGNGCSWSRACRPSCSASWSSPSCRTDPVEARWLAARIARLARNPAWRPSGKRRAHTAHTASCKRCTDTRVILLCLVYFMNVIGGYGLDFFMPTLLKVSFPGASSLKIGLLSADSAPDRRCSS